MPQFPVISSTLSPEALSGYLLTQFGLRGPVACKLLKAGVNHSYLVQDGRRSFVFRVYCRNWRTRAEIGEELRLINLLKAKAIPVSQPVADLRGNFIQAIDAPEGTRYAVLFTFAEGVKPESQSLELSAQFGVVMARMHLITHNLRLARTTYAPQSMIVEPMTHIRRFLPPESQELSDLEAMAAVLQKDWAAAQVKEMRSGAVHLDIWQDNVHVAHGAELTLFDFDFCGNGWLALDIAYHILQLQASSNDPERVHAQTEAFLTGYTQVAPLSAEELRLLPMLSVALYIFYLGVQCRRHADWSSTFLSEDYLRRYIRQRIWPAWERWAPLR